MEAHTAESKRAMEAEGKTTHRAGKETMTGAGEGNAAELVNLVIQEHNEAKTLYQQYQSQSNKEQKQQICRTLSEKLVAHGGKEEIALYPAMKDCLPNGEKEVEQAKREHQQLTEDLYKLEQCSWENVSEVDACLSKIMKEFEEHVRDEENRLLPLFSQHISKENAQKVLHNYQKATVTTRPHPSAPREGMAAAAAHMASKPLDAMRDAMSGKKK